ncbi:MAG: NFACT RNA binding domain-containing protein [Planctomycetota bacterium]
MKLSAAHLVPLTAELDRLLRGLVVKDVAPLPPRDLMLVIEGPGGSGPPVLRLRLSASRQAARLHLQIGRTWRHKGPMGPFYQQVAGDLVGARIKAVTPVRGDRIALVEFHPGPSGEGRSLLLELFGLHANLYLLGPGDTLLAPLVSLPEPSGGRPARLEVGRTWRAPEGGPAPAQTVDFEGDFPLPKETTPYAAAPLSQRVELTLGAEADALHREEQRKTLTARLTRKLQSARTRLAGLHDRSRAAQKAERVRQDGDLLKGHLGSWKRGQSKITLTDWFDPEGGERTLELDPKLDPAANVERYFTRYRKLTRSSENLPAEIADQEQRVAALEGLCETAPTCADPEDFEKQAVDAGLLDPAQEADPRKKKEAPPRLPYRTFEGHGGVEIRVGRSARDNDELTLRHARGSDLWLHTADAPGSHVILRAERGREPSQQAILDAAMLAVHFSPLKNASRASVHVVHQKQVKKPKGAKPGLVTLAGGKRVTVRMDSERLKALLATQGHQGENPRSKS